MVALIKGKYRDWIDSGTSVGDTEVTSSEWKSNRIVQNSDILIASLMKGEPNTSGILFLAFGTGEESWDDTNPNAAAGTQQLANEFFRHRIAPSELIYLDELGRPSIRATRRIGVNVNLIGSERVEGDFLSLREFGLYGGDASDALNSGLLINYVIHPRIDLTATVTLNRQLILTFDGSLSVAAEPVPIPVPSAPQWLRDSPLIILDGVGLNYVERFTSAGVTTISGLSDLDTSQAAIDIPPMKLVELRAKARLAMQMVANNVFLDSELQDNSLRQLMSTSVAQLVARSGESEANVQALIEQFGCIQMVLDNRYLEGKTLLEIVTGG